MRECRKGPPARANQLAPEGHLAGGVCFTVALSSSMRPQESQSRAVWAVRRGLIRRQELGISQSNSVTSVNLWQQLQVQSCPSMTPPPLQVSPPFSWQNWKFSEKKLSANRPVCMSLASSMFHVFLN